MTQKSVGSHVAVFLDRDGVINAKAPEGDYIKTWAEFSFLPGVVRAIVRLTESGYLVFIATNQRGVARGLMSLDDLQSIHGLMLEHLAARGASISGIYCCTHDLADECECRKPRPGLLLRAAEDHGLDLERSWMIGDRESDVQAGLAAGCQVIMIRKQRHDHSAVERRSVTYPVVPDLPAAVRMIVGGTS